MAATSLTVAPLSWQGVTHTLATANADGHYFVNDGSTFLSVNNAGASSCIVTLSTPATLGGVSVEDPTVTVAAGASKLIGPFNPAAFNAAGGRVNITFSQVTSVTIAAFKV